MTLYEELEQRVMALEKRVSELSREAQADPGPAPAPSQDELLDEFLDLVLKGDSPWQPRLAASKVAQMATPGATGWTFGSESPEEHERAMELLGRAGYYQSFSGRSLNAIPGFDYTRPEDFKEEIRALWKRYGVGFRRDLRREELEFHRLDPEEFSDLGL